MTAPVRAIALALALAALAPPPVLARKPPRLARPAKQPATPRQPWLLFPIDLRAFQRVSSKWGLRKLQRHTRQHKGVDLVAPPGALVVAAREGRVSAAGRDRLCGWYVKLEHENGWHTVYCHLRRDPRPAGVVAGAAVATQMVVGEVGSTGHSTGPHLHFSLVDPAGRSRDPLLALFTPRETYQLLQRGVAR